MNQNLVQQWEAVNRRESYGVWMPGPRLQTIQNFWSAAVMSNGRIYVIGNGDQVEILDTPVSSSASAWRRTRGPSLTRGLPSSWTAVELNGAIFCVGGNDVHRLEDSADAQWRLLDPKLRSFRTSHCAVSLKGRIYVLGGSSEPNDLSSIENYDPQKDGWFLESHSMNVGRKQFASVADPTHKCIYAIGGYSYEGGLASVERRDLRAEKWSLMAPMSMRRYGHSAVFVCGLIYAMGGCGIRNVEIYEPRMNKWFEGPSLSVVRHYGAAVSIDNRILAIGGSDEGSTEILHLILAADCSVSARCRAVSSPSSESGFDLCLSSAEYLVRNKVVAPLETPTSDPSNRSLLDDLDASRPLGFPVPSVKEVKIDISDIEIDDDVWVRPSRVRLLVVGNARVGKTSLIKNLSSGGTEFDTNENSTEVGDVKTMEISIRNHAWVDTTHGTGTTLLSRLMQQQVEKGKPEMMAPLRNTVDTTSGQASEEPAMPPPASAHVDNSASPTTESQVPSGSTSQPSPNVPRERVIATERIDVTTRVLTELEKETLSVSVLDFAGQNVFRVFDPLFFGTKSLYFCVFNLRVLHDAHGKGFLEKAIEENVISWLRIIANVGACNVSMHGTLSKVVLIGTHGGFAHNETSQQREAFLKAINAFIKRFLEQPQLGAFFEVCRFRSNLCFMIVENNPRHRDDSLRQGQVRMMKWLSKTIEEFHRRLPKVLLRNLVLEQMCRECKDVVLAVDSIRDRIRGIASVCRTNIEMKKCFDDLVALGCFFACSSDGHMIVLQPDAFIQTCAQLIPQTQDHNDGDVDNNGIDDDDSDDNGHGEGVGGIMSVHHSEKTVYKYLLENAGIIPYETAKLILEGHLLANEIGPADSHSLVANQVLAMLVTLGVVVPMDPESKLAFFPQWHRHCDSLIGSPDTLESRWKTECSEKVGFKLVSCSVRCVGLGHLIGIIDGIVTDLHFWRFITFLGKRSLYPDISLKSPPALGLDVIVCRPNASGSGSCSLQSRIRLDRKQGTSSIFHFDTLSSPRETDVPDLVALLTAFLNEDLMSKSVLSCELVAPPVVQVVSARGPSLSSCTRSEFTAAFHANMNPFLNYFATHYEAIFTDAVHALYDVNPGLSDGVLAMDNREGAVKRWMQMIVLNPKHEDAFSRFHDFLSHHHVLFEDVNAILFPPFASIPTRAASQAPTAHGAASSSQASRPHDAPFSIGNLPSRSQFLQIYHENASSIHDYLVQHDQLMKDAVASLPIAQGKGWTSVLARKLGESPPQAAQWFVGSCLSVSDQSLKDFWTFLNVQGSNILNGFISVFNAHSPGMQHTQPARVPPGVGIILTVTPEEGTAVKVAFIQLCDVGKTAKNVSENSRNQLLESLCGKEDPSLPDFLDFKRVSVECIEARTKLSDDHDHLLRFQTYVFRNKSRGNAEVYRLHHISFGDVQGSVHFAVVVPQLLLHFKPSHVLVSGVCAGYPGYNDIGFGTVVVATDVFSVTQGKATHESMKFDIERITLNSAPGANLQALISNTVSVWNAKIEDPSSGIATFIAASAAAKRMPSSTSPNDIPIKANALTGSIGCAVDFVKEDLQNKAGWDQLRRDTASRKLRAIEMEGVGIAKAIENEPRKPIFLFQKAVMDFAGSRTDAAKPYASFTSALFAAQFLFCSVLPELYE
eukprot:ANDGO_00489.mRNA.1 Kelch-like protein diablo